MRPLMSAHFTKHPSFDRTATSNRTNSRLSFGVSLESERVPPLRGLARCSLVLWGEEPEQAHSILDACEQSRFLAMAPQHNLLLDLVAVVQSPRTDVRAPSVSASFLGVFYYMRAVFSAAIFISTSVTVDMQSRFGLSGVPPQLLSATGGARVAGVGIPTT